MSADAVQGDADGRQRRPQGLRRRHRRRRRPMRRAGVAATRARRSRGRHGRSPRFCNHPAVEAANAMALARFIEAQPVLTDVASARDVLPGMAGGRRLIVHAGPPIAWPEMCGPMRGAVLGAVRARRLGRFGRRGRAPGRARRRRARTLPPPWRGRADGRHHQPVDAGVRRREQGGGQSRVLQLQRRARQGAALRRQRAGGDRPPAHDGRASSRRRCAPCWRAPARSS